MVLAQYCLSEDAYHDPEMLDILGRNEIGAAGNEIARRKDQSILNGLSDLVIR